MLISGISGFYVYSVITTRTTTVITRYKPFHRFWYLISTCSSVTYFRLVFHRVPCFFFSVLIFHRTLSDFCISTQWVLLSYKLVKMTYLSISAFQWIHSVCEEEKISAGYNWLYGYILNKNTIKIDKIIAFLITVCCYL